MSHGLANSTTLYDQSGNPVTVSLVDGEYRLRTHDQALIDKMDMIIVLLTQLCESSESRHVEPSG